MSLPRYPAYKDSGVPWLGEVPAHWAVKRLKRTCAVHPSNVDKKSYEDELPVVLCNYTDVYRNDVIRAEMDFMPATAAREQVEKFSLRAGDVLITKDSETADDIAISAYVPDNLPGVVCGYHLSIVRPQQGVSGAYVKRLFDAAFAKAYFEVRANGLTRVGLSQYAIDNVECPWPPLAEQEAIAAFLDRETARVDALVAEQGRLIALLKEKRQAVISHAVTRGLNPDAPRKPSGVAWLGDVPAHWEVRKASSVGAFFGSEQIDESELVDEGMVPFLKVSSLSSSHEVSRFDWWLSPVAVARCNLRSGFLVFPKRGAAIFLNKVNVMRGPAAVDSNLMGWQLDPRCDLVYMAHVIQSRRLDELADVSSVPQLNHKHLEPVPLPVPPLEEQKAIVEFLDRETSAIDALIAEAERAIALLGERRAALIAAAVTGQVDVRGVAAGEGV